MAYTASATRFKLVFRVPTSGLAACKTAIFSVGAGRHPGELYSECCFTLVGTGQFRPGDKANPHIGQPGTLEEVQEARVEALCVGEDVVKEAVKALKRWVIDQPACYCIVPDRDLISSAHPYERPSYEVYKLEDY
jgi:hypothetical protein